MGTHRSDKSGSVLREIRRSLKRLLSLRRRQKFLSAAEAERYRQALDDLYRSGYGLSMHPLQRDPRVVPPSTVVDKVQGHNKADRNTFLGTGYRQTAAHLRDLHAHGYDVGRMRRMLDMGVGTGRLLLHFLPFELERYGCDVNPTAVEWTSGVLGDLADIQLTKREPPLPYSDGFFDLVIASAVLTHTPVCEQSGWIAELGRVLKPGGCLIASVHDFSKIPVERQREGWHELGSERGLHMNAYVTRELLEEIWSRDFEVLEVRRDPPRQAQVLGRRRES